MRGKTLMAALCLAGTLLPGGVKAAAPDKCPGEGEPTMSMTGSIASEFEGFYVMVPFAVPRGTTRVGVRLCHDQPDSPASQVHRHVLDLGLYGARGADGLWDSEEFRGWGGSSRPDPFVSPKGATLGFEPGPIAPGLWAAELGAALVAGQEEGDADDAVAWRLEVFLSRDPVHSRPRWRPAPYDARPASTKPGWYKGDFHVHAEHSGPSAATMVETFDYAFAPPPDGAGLDFVSLSDYVTDRHWSEIGRVQNRYPGKLIIRSAEVITYHGHINNHASVTWVDYRTGPILEWRDGELVTIRDGMPPSRIFDAIHAEGGWTQVNHPTIFPGPLRDLCRGCAWEYSDAETDWSQVDAFEVQTGPSGTYDPDDHELGPNPFTPPAIRRYDELRAQGFRITAVGSSDSHHASEENLTQSPVGEATTVVYARELSERGIKAAVLAGHAYVKFFSADGPDLRFTAAEAGGKPVMMGDEIRAGEATFTAEVLGAGPSPEPRLLIVLRDGVPIDIRPVTEDEFVYELVASTPGDYRLQLMRGTAIEALTNPITLLGG